MGGKYRRQLSPYEYFAIIINPSNNRGGMYFATGKIALCHVNMIPN